MHADIARSTNHEALQAELHREELIREAALTRLARGDHAQDVVIRSTEPSLVRRIRSALGAIGRPVRTECPECA
jgi:hypothetical protein